MKVSIVRMATASLLFLAPLWPAPPAAGSSSGVSSPSPTVSGSADAVIIAGADLSALIGKPISGLRLVSLRDGVQEVIPFQVDQKDSANDWVWDKALRGGTAGDDQDPAGRAVLDANDLLVFLAQDTGDRLPSAPQVPQAEQAVEIELRDSVTHAPRWAYLAYYAAPPPLSARRYMRFSWEERKISSPLYELTYSKEQIAVLKDLTMGGHTVLDRLKVRGKARIKLGFLKSSLSFNEEDVHGYIEGYIDGPVRTVMRTVNFLRLPLGLRTPRVNCDHFYYPDHSEVPLLLSLRFLVSEASLRLTADFRDSPFQSAYLGGDKQPMILGEGAQSLDRLQADPERRWIALTGENGAVLNLIGLPDTVERHSTVSLYLLDDPEARNRPEAYAGSEPEEGFTVRTQPGLPKGDYILYLYLFVSPHSFAPGSEARALSLMRRGPASRSTAP